MDCNKKCECSHNPYFNRWFSAILLADSDITTVEKSHNPYFNRWFSAMIPLTKGIHKKKVTILILIDGFLQLDSEEYKKGHKKGSQSLF